MPSMTTDRETLEQRAALLRRAIELRQRLDWRERAEKGEAPPTIPGLGPLTPDEAEYYYGLQGLAPQDEILEGIRQFRAIQRADRLSESEPPSEPPGPPSEPPLNRSQLPQDARSSGGGYPPSALPSQAILSEKAGAREEPSTLGKIGRALVEAFTSPTFTESPPAKILSAPFVAAENLVEALGLPPTIRGLSFAQPQVDLRPGQPPVVTPGEHPQGPTAGLIGDLLSLAIPFGGARRPTPTAPAIEPVTPSLDPKRMGTVLLRKELPVLPPGAAIIEPPRPLPPEPRIPGAPAITIPDEVGAQVTQRQGPRPAQFTESQRIDRILEDAGLTRKQVREAIRVLERNQGDTSKAREVLEELRQHLPDPSTESLTVFVNRFKALDRPRVRKAPTQAKIAESPVFPPEQPTGEPPFEGLFSKTETVFASQVGRDRPIPNSPAVQNSFIGPQILRVEQQAAREAQERAMGVVRPPATPPKNPYHLEPKEHAALMEGFKDWPTIPLATRVGVQEVPVPPSFLRDIQAEKRHPKVKGDPVAQLVDPASPMFSRKQAGPRDLGTATLNPDGSLELLPPAYERFFEATFDVLDRTGPAGVQLSNLFRNLYHTVRRNTVRDTDALHKRFQAIFGLRPGITGKLIRGNPFDFASMTKLYNVTEAEVRDLFDYLYVGMDEKRWQALDPARHGKPVPPKIAEAAQAYFAGDGKTFGGTRSISGHPGIQGRQADPNVDLDPDTVLTPLGPIPVGEPTPFMPQQPISPNLKAILEGRTLRLLYESEQRRHPNPDLTLEEFRRRLINMFSEDKLVRARRYAGINNMRALDLTLNGTASAYDTAKRLGYETDPLRAFFRFANGAYFRGESRLIEKQANELADVLRTQFNEQRQGSGNWVRIMADRVMGIPTEDVVDRTVTDWITRIRAFNDLTILGPVSTISSFNQIVPIIARGGFFNFLRGVGNQIAHRALDPGELGTRSGAIFTNLYNDFFVPGGAMERWASHSLRAQGFSGVDKWIRLAAAQTGYIYLQKTVKKLLQDPSNPTLRGMIRELDLNPMEVLQKATLDPKAPFGVRIAEEVVDRGIQAFVEKTSGGTTPAHLPLWMLNQKDHARLLLQYRKYAGSNGAELVRYAKHSPSTRVAMARIARGLFAGALAGEVTGDLIDVITLRENPFGLHPRSKTLEQAVGPIAGTLLEDLALGLGTVQFAIALALLESTEEAILSSVVGANVTEAVKGALNVKKAVEGDPTGLIKQAVRRVPVVGPTLRGAAQHVLIPPTGGLQPLKPFPDEP